MKTAIICQPYNQEVVEAERGLPARAAWKVLGRLPVIARWLNHRRMFIEFLANPRSTSYMLELAKVELPRNLEGNEFYLLVRGPLSSADLAVASALGPVEALPDAPRQWEQSLFEQLRAGGYHCVVFLYHDAIGLGWRDVETAVSRTGIKAVRALSGRRRMFVVDGRMRRALTFRRWLSRSRFVELALALAIFPIGAWCAALDRLSARVSPRGVGRGEY